MKIIYATDGSRSATQAALLFAALADPHRIEVKVLSVAHDPMTVIGPPFVPEFPPLQLHPGAMHEQAERAADLGVEILRGRGIEATPEVVEGDPVARICAVAETSGADLVVIGAGSSSWLGNLLLGSVSTQVLHHSPASVMVVHRFAESDTPRVLFGADGSDCSYHALEAFAGFARPGSCKVTALAVAEMPALIHAPATVMGLAFDPAVQQQQFEELGEQARHRAHDAVGAFARHRFEAAAVAGIGHGAKQLLEEASTGGYDLVVVGSRGLGPVKRALLGSTSDHLARLAPATFIGRDPIAVRGAGFGEC